MKKTHTVEFMAALPGTAQQIAKRIGVVKSTVARYSKALIAEGYVVAGDRVLDALGPGSWRIMYRATGKPVPEGWRPPETRDPRSHDEAHKMREVKASEMAEVSRNLMAGLFGVRA